ncbi:hypothetical protein [Sinorhizobium meliloti]|uniref:hypothetical protein n=1 Tax=Rhizobium meliloti TaxID=382 RepID=UPI00299EE4FB
MDAEHHPRLAGVAKHLPFVGSLAGFDFGRPHLPFDLGKRNRPPPEGRRHISNLHFLHLSKAKEIRSPKTMPKNS